MQTRNSEECELLKSIAFLYLSAGNCCCADCDSSSPGPSSSSGVSGTGTGTRWRPIGDLQSRPTWRQGSESKAPTAFYWVPGNFYKWRSSAEVCDAVAPSPNWRNICPLSGVSSHPASGGYSSANYCSATNQNGALSAASSHRSAFCYPRHHLHDCNISFTSRKEKGETHKIQVVKHSMINIRQTVSDGGSLLEFKRCNLISQVRVSDNKWSDGSLYVITSSRSS